ncbi:hypothetical protein B0H14DRAFT_3442572 [Mycena olivaceomarginata]|nr:hypothetical protein B0H14DRAFT_3442572 [Mycena olivaceomarginata]
MLEFQLLDSLGTVEAATRIAIEFWFTSSSAWACSSLSLLGPIPWLLSAELFLLWMRARSMSIASASDLPFECIVRVAMPPLFGCALLLPRRHGSSLGARGVACPLQLLKQQYGDL